jgi:hypothetical protein
VAALTQLVEHAAATRRQTQALRAEMARLTRSNVETRRTHLLRRASCSEAVRRAERNRDTLPTWPAWGGPTPDLRLTLVLLD